MLGHSQSSKEVCYYFLILNFPSVDPAGHYFAFRVPVTMRPTRFPSAFWFLKHIIKGILDFNGRFCFPVLCTLGRSRLDSGSTEFSLGSGQSSIVGGLVPSADVSAVV